MIDKLVWFSPQIVFYMGCVFVLVIVGFCLGLVIKIVRR